MKALLTQRIVTPLRLLGMGAAVAVATGSALAGGGGTNYYLDGGAYPWGQSGVFQETMDTVFGLGGWLEDDYGTVDVGTLLSKSTNFIYMEGGDSSASELETFLAANQAALEDWVFAGGRLFLNAAPNEGASQNWGFGGVMLTAPDFNGADEAHLDAGHPVVNGAFGAVGLDYTGNFFSHGTVSGGGISPFIANGAGNAVAAELIWGQGGVVFGGMTSYNFHDPDPDSATLRWNILAYTKALQGPGVDCSGFPCGNNDQKVLLCHVPRGNPENEHTLCISPKAVATHLENHDGDHCGPCGTLGGASITLIYEGDIGGDGAVGIADFLLLFSAWGLCPEQPDVCPADLDIDGEVGILDLLTLLANWG